LNKSISLLRFQLRVLGAYFKNPKWNVAKAKEFVIYALYYFINFWYYTFLTIFESFIIKNKTLKDIDTKMTEVYNSENQFWVSLKESYRQKSEKIVNLTYGETSYFAIKESLKFVELNKDDVFYDLGCGTGKTVFFANAIYGAKSIGVDIVGDFIDNANFIVNNLKLKNISFLEKSIFDLNLKDGTVFYITPTCFDAENMKKVLKMFEKLPKGSRLIVLSRHLPLPNLELVGRKNLYYSWGKAETFYYKVI
jgi:SAM-dependent methyltransferase